MKYITPEIKSVIEGDVINVTDKIDLAKDVIMKRGQYLVIETENKGDFVKVTAIKYGNHASVAIHDSLTKYTFFQGNSIIPDESKAIVKVVNNTLVIGRMNKKVSVTFEE